MTGNELVGIFAALADPTRLHILDILDRKGSRRCGPVSVGERGLCACDVESALPLSQAAVSHHLGILRRAGLVEAEKRGRWMFYRRNDRLLEEVAAALRREVDWTSALPVPGTGRAASR